MHVRRPLRSNLFRILVALAAGVWLSGTLPADDWRQFRGPNGSGVAAGNYPLPTEFSLTDKVKWSVKLGDGIASAVIASGRVFVTAMINEQTFGVLCFEAATGNPLWKKEFKTGKLPRITPPNSFASST